MKSPSKKDYPVLPAEEQIALFNRYQILVNSLRVEGRSFRVPNIKWYERTYPEQKRMVRSALKARERLILSNEGMIIRLAQRYSNGLVSTEELVQVGREACIYALTKYDPDKRKTGKQTKFSSYAQFWIHSKIADAVKRAQQVNVPDYAAKKGLAQYRFVSHEDLSARAPSVYDRLVVNEEVDPLAILSDKEIEILSHHYSLGGKTDNHPRLDLWGDGDKVSAIVDKVRQYAEAC